MVENVKVLQRCKADLIAATEKAKDARDAAIRAEGELHEAKREFEEAIQRIGESA
jgi:hypothetical protein